MKIKTLFDGTEINETEFKQWLEALRSGEFKQTKETLQDNEGYCCLGVACKVLIPDKLLIDELDDGSEVMYGTTPLDQPDCPFWLRRINRDFWKRTRRELITLNDHFEYSFKDIADCLEHVYIKGLKLTIKQGK